jgi:hypothetical protein
VLLSVVGLAPDVALDELRRTRRLLPAATRLLVGGSLLNHEDLPHGMTFVPSLEQVADVLGSPAQVAPP